MRIAILAAILVLLLSPGLRSGAAAPLTTPLRPTPAYAQAGGTVEIERQGGRATLVFALHGLPVGKAVSGVTGARGAAPVYVVWLADAERHLYNLGTLPVDSAGNVASTLTPFVGFNTEGTLAVSVEPRADVPAPTAPHDTIILSAALVGTVMPQTSQISADLGPDWFAPIIPATLGLTLLRHAARTRRAELRARRLHTTLPSAPPA